MCEYDAANNLSVLSFKMHGSSKFQFNKKYSTTSTVEAKMLWWSADEIEISILNWLSGKYVCASSKRFIYVCPFLSCCTSSGFGGKSTPGKDYYTIVFFALIKAQQSAQVK